MAIKTQGTDLYAIDPRDDSLIDVGCVTSIDGIDSAIDQIETTCLNSRERTYLAGLATPGTATFTINTDPGDPAHLQLYELKQLGENIRWAIGWSDGPVDSEGVTTAPPSGVDSDGDFELPTTRSWLVFEGFMNAFPFSFAQNAVVQSTIGIQVSGAQVLVPKS